MGVPREKEVARVFNSLQALGKGQAKEEEFFQKTKSLYENLDEKEKEALFRTIVNEIEVSKDEIKPVLEELASCDDNAEWSKLLAELRGKAYSPRLNLFRKISRFPGGLRFLLDFRGDLLSIQRFSETNLRPLDADIVLLFEVWFQDGFLYLEEITLDSSYRQIELIKNSDLVHPMTTIEEMGQRLGDDRRCFALYHRLMPYEPIIFIEVALTRGIVGNISDIIETEQLRTEKGESDTAIFYSINNTQNGLAGLGLGRLLIGEVVEYLRKDNAHIKHFATLSPITGFWDHYFKPILEGNDRRFSLKHSDTLSFFSKKQWGRILERQGLRKEETGHFNQALCSILSDPEWVNDRELGSILRDPLIKIAYHYISNEKNPQGKPLNSVAGFHLGNGATVSQKHINFFANLSPKGLAESCGMMVNYIYTPGWLRQIPKTFRWFDKMEIKGFFSRIR